MLAPVIQTKFDILPFTALEVDFYFNMHALTIGKLYYIYGVYSQQFIN